MICIHLFDDVSMYNLLLYYVANAEILGPSNLLKKKNRCAVGAFLLLYISKNLLLSWALGCCLPLLTFALRVVPRINVQMLENEPVH
jgi:hypothetical protein